MVVIESDTFPIVDTRISARRVFRIDLLPVDGHFRIQETVFKVIVQRLPRDVKRLNIRDCRLIVREGRAMQLDFRRMVRTDERAEHRVNEDFFLNLVRERLRMPGT